ncbi:MAG: 3-methyl-2-oxobutanoate hydroxymethyltransferase [Candidatus Eremiobacteraeota bacterium]|nr:3-methyl-2-oxobutanoate hydroxymethyltransferase [Candidatus Eremiobacteraeota bacterium]MBV9972158.1 3-methyl-2-oxobutanoate hydroxymethyltransferase [Candidatus Eremiobacteraeota bacterium]
MNIARRKNASEPFAVMTAYDAAFARCAEQAGIDVLLVGDSVGTVVLGYDSTVPVTLDDMIHHTAAVARGAKHAHIIGDMPFGSYQTSDAEAVRSASRLVQEGRATSVKLEGGVRAADRIKAIVGAGIPVMGHIGVLPQTAGLGPGFRMRSNRERLLDDARAVQDAGAYAIVLEVVSGDLAAEITRELKIPTIGIGSGPACDGQVLVLYDLLGLYEQPPSFVKQYADFGTQAIRALEEFARDVASRKYPPPL